jgi:hypothetical protein
LADAGAALRKHRRRGGWQLGDALALLAFDELKGGAYLGVDAAALDEAGLGPTTPLTEGPSVLHAIKGSVADAAISEDETGLPAFDRLGLVFVTGQAGVLLTTRRGRGNWLGPDENANAAAEQTLTIAAGGGSDPLGRVIGIADWLRGVAPTGLPAKTQLGWSDPDTGILWADWEADAGSPPESVRIISDRAVIALAAALTGAAGLLALILWQAPVRVQILAAGVALAVGGLACFFTPEPLLPALGGFVGVTAAFAVVRPALPLWRSRLRGSTGSAVAVACVFVVGAGTSGQQSATTVFLLPGAGGESVLAPPQIL